MESERRKRLEERVSKLRQTLKAAGEARNNVGPNLAVELQGLDNAWASFGLSWADRVTGRDEDLLKNALQRAEAAAQAVQRASGDHTEMNAELTKCRGELSNATTLLLLFGIKLLNRDEHAIEKIDKNASDKLTEWEKKLSGANDQLATSLSEAQKVLNIAREASRRAGIAEKTSAFSVAQRAHKRWSIFWGLASIGTGVALICAAANAVGVQPPYPTKSWHIAGNLSFYLPRAIIVSVLSSLTVFFARNFRAAKHNEVINEHRSGALSTFETLHAATKGDTADAITLYAAEAAFGSQASGYSSSSNETQDMASIVSSLRGQP